MERKEKPMRTQISFTQADRILAKSRQMPFLEELKEEMDNELHLVILGAAIGENAAYDDSGENPILGEILAQCKPIFPDSRQRFDIVFEDYIIYPVRNESYSSFPETEKRMGTYLLECEKSSFLNYLALVTDACRLEDGSFYPAPWKHYGIYTQNHIVDIIATKEPKVFYAGDTD